MTTPEASQPDPIPYPPLALLLAALLLPLLLLPLRRVRRARDPLDDLAGPPRAHWWKGNFHLLFRDGLAYNLALVRTYGGAVRVPALFGSSLLYLADPLAITHVLTHTTANTTSPTPTVSETPMFIAANALLFGPGLLATLGPQHLRQRRLLNPVWGPANLRRLARGVWDVAAELVAVFGSLVDVGGDEGGGAGDAEIDVYPWFQRAALEYTAQAAFGHTWRALALDPRTRSPYVDSVRRFGPTALRLLLLRPLTPLLTRLPRPLRTRIPAILHRVPGLGGVSAALGELVHIVRAMEDEARAIFEARRAEFLDDERRRELLDEGRKGRREEDRSNGRAGRDVQDGDGVRAGERGLRVRMKGLDLMSVMLRANASTDAADRLTDEEIIGQISTFTFAGFDNTAIALSRIVHLLAARPRVQARLRAEVRDAVRAVRARAGVGVGAGKGAGAGAERSGMHSASRGLGGGGTDGLEGDEDGDREWEWEGERDGNEEAREGGALGYDALMALPVLDAVVKETLRVWPPTSLMGRIVKHDTTIPLHRPVSSASASTSATPSTSVTPPTPSTSSETPTHCTTRTLNAIPVKAGTSILISILAANRDRDIWGADADEWRMERWLGGGGDGDGDSNSDGDGGEGEDGEAAGTRRGTGTGTGGVRYPGVYASMMTFLAGPRACIAFKFAELEIKQLLAALLEAFHFEEARGKEVRWRVDGVLVPGWRWREFEGARAGEEGNGEEGKDKEGKGKGDGDAEGDRGPSVPLLVRRVREEDFIWS